MEMTDKGEYTLTKKELAVLLDVAHDKKAPLDERTVRFHGRDVFVTDRRCLLVYTARTESARVQAFGVDANDLRTALKQMKVKDLLVIWCDGARVCVDRIINPHKTESPRDWCGRFDLVDLDSLDLSEQMLRNVAKDREVSERTDRFVIASRFIHLASKLMAALGDPECWTMVTGATESCPVRLSGGHVSAPSDALLVAMPLVPCADTAPGGF